MATWQEFSTNTTTEISRSRLRFWGVKRNILRLLADRGCAVEVVPAETSAVDVLSRNPDGIFLSNGPGDPGALHLRGGGH